MKESLQQIAEQRLQQSLSPLQVQVARTLEMNGPEFEEEVRRVLDDNPALEEDTDTPLLPQGDDSGSEFGETAEQMQLADYGSEDDIPNYRLNASNRSADDPVYDPASSQASEMTLHDYLEAQLDVADIPDPRVRQLARYAVGNIDSNGYLTRTADEMINDITFATGIVPARDEMQKAVAAVQALDPAGVGAYDLRQCLLLQLARMESNEAVDDAREIVTHYFDLFANRHYDQLKAETHLGDDRLRAALEEIRSLTPKPGAAFDDNAGADRLRRIVPDFEVEGEGQRLTVSLSGVQPQLRVAESFNIDDNTGMRRNSAEMLFVKRKRDEAADFIRAAAMRRDTLLRVMRAIVKIQRDFFVTGDPLRLKPMILKDVAQITGDDLSVISRATAGKYVQTPTGIYPLKFFFNERPKDDLDASAHELLDALRKEIEGEDHKHPLSDQALAEQLAAKGYDIARRTVTKYRERLGFPVARLRREL